MVLLGGRSAVAAVPAPSQLPHSPLRTKSPQQRHPNASANKKLQLMAINTHAGTNVISISCPHINILLRVINTLLRSVCMLQVT